MFTGRSVWKPFRLGRSSKTTVFAGSTLNERTALPGEQRRTSQPPKSLRHVHGALSLETIQARPIFEDNRLRGLDVERKNRATGIIEDFMIAANGVAVQYLAAKNFPSVRRVVRTPKRWDRIVELARAHR